MPDHSDHPDDPTLAHYSLVSWVRRGLSSLIADAPAAYYASLPVSLAVNGAAVEAPRLRLYGPGDVTSLDARAVIRTDPRGGADAFEPNYLAMVELAAPDLPWMLTPSAPANGRLRPWICLIVIPETAGASIMPRPGGLSVLRLDAPLDPRAELPDLDGIDAWAHAQVVGDGDLSNISANAGTLSRLIAPRQLEPGRRYNACIVPTYRAGVNAGLGLPVDEHDLAPAWDSNTAAPFSLPVYHHFRFQTGPGGDFASLAQRIKPPKEPIAVGTRPMDASAPGFGAAAAPGLTLGLEGALRAVGGGENPWPAGAQAPYESELRKVLNPPADPQADPIVAPPTYGRSQTGADLTATPPPVWLGELNLDPRTRAAAGAGAQVVQRDQEALMASAWGQVGEIRKANRLLRQAQLARQVSASLNDRHLNAMPGDGVYLQITAPVHGRVRLASAGSATLRAQVRASRVPADAISPALRKLTRPRGPVGRQLAAAGAPRLVDRLNLVPAASARALVVAGPVQAPRGMVALDDVSPTFQVSKMSVAALHAAAGWKIAATATTSTTTTATTTTTTTVETHPLIETHPVTETHLITGTHPAAPPLSTDHTLTTDRADRLDTTLHQAVLIDWSADADVPDLLKGARANLPAPLVFPTAPAALAQMQESFRTVAVSVTGYLDVAPAPPADPPPLGGSAALAPIRDQLRARLLPENTIVARLKSRVPLGAGADPLQPLSAGPRFPQAMYAPLAELSPEWMLPGISKVPIDTAALLATNPRFVEAYMVGLNEEMARELLWREYPFGRQGTSFQTFWGASAPDIPPIATFAAAAHLGGHENPATGGSLVLLVRAELFRRYPNALVSAVRAEWNGSVRRLGTERKWPIFRGEIGADVTFFGFDVDDPQGSKNPTDRRPGWYFVIEEHVTEPRFGLEPETKAPGPSWNDLRWSDVTPAHGFLDTAQSLPAREGVPWGSGAAAMAFILMRKPVRVALHGQALLGKEGA